jgi:hypothetical protein
VARRRASVVRAGSMSGTGGAADPEHVVAAVAAAMPETGNGYYGITSHAGCLVCEVRG